LGSLLNFAGPASVAEGLPFCIEYDIGNTMAVIAIGEWTGSYNRSEGDGRGGLRTIELKDLALQLEASPHSDLSAWLVHGD
jgi:hypothetical protein